LSDSAGDVEEYDICRRANAAGGERGAWPHLRHVEQRGHQRHRKALAAEGRVGGTRSEGAPARTRLLLAAPTSAVTAEEGSGLHPAACLRLVLHARTPSVE
jgi:hypothetical protein